MIKPALEAATTLTLSTPEEPDMALARGAALASANAPLFVSSTAALAYALDPATGSVDPTAYRAVPQVYADPAVVDDLAYAGIGDEDDFITGTYAGLGVAPDDQLSKRPFLAAMSVMMIFVVGVVTLLLSLAITIRPHVGQRASLGQNLVVPAKPAPAPPPQGQVPAPPVPTPVPTQQPVPVGAPPALRAPAPAPAPALPPPAVLPVIPQFPLIVPPAVPGVPLAPRGGEGGGHGGFGGGARRGRHPGPRVRRRSRRVRRWSRRGSRAPVMTFIVVYIGLGVVGR